MGSLAAAYSCKNRIFLLQVTRESVSGTTSHVCGSESAMKLKVRIINHHHHSTKLYRKNITHLLPSALLLVLCTRHNTDGNKLVV